MRRHGNARSITLLVEDEEEKKGEESGARGTQIDIDKRGKEQSSGSCKQSQYVYTVYVYYIVYTKPINVRQECVLECSVAVAYRST